jgi:hypothetical protein
MGSLETESDSSLQLPLYHLFLNQQRKPLTKRKVNHTQKRVLQSVKNLGSEQIKSTKKEDWLYLYKHLKRYNLSWQYSQHYYKLRTNRVCDDESRISKGDKLDGITVKMQNSDQEFQVCNKYLYLTSLAWNQK